MMQRFFKVWMIYLLPLLFGADLLAQPAPKLEDLFVCYEGEVITIASECDDCTTNKCSGYFVFNKNEPDNLSYVNDYDVINFAEGKGMMVELIKYIDAYQPSNPDYYERAVVNIKTGEYIIPFGSQYIKYVFEDRLFIVNKDKQGRLIDTYGKQLNKKIYGNIGYIESLGYFDKTMYDEEEVIFDKNEAPVISFQKFNISEGIDAYNFIARPNEAVSEELFEGVYIIDRKENTLFYDEYGDIFIQKDSVGNNNVIGFGLENTEDSYSLLIKNKKGKWYNPMTEFLSNHFIHYISTVYLYIEGGQNSVSHKNKEVLCYAAGMEYDQETEKGYFLDTKGKVIVEVEGAPRFNAVHFNASQDKKVYPFIYFFTQYSSESFAVYDEDGTILIAHPDNYEYFMPDEITKAGYYAFINDTLDETYLFYGKTKRLLTLQGKQEFKTLADVQKHFVSER